ncbi:MAG: hypothetical protein K9L59_02165 [Desulfobacterales bacterium]|nr:hypothetical protein [Desulfobacterales bacterium]MCF8078457.1 hypothetical protein [Desulfobacterales bacterium]
MKMNVRDEFFGKSAKRRVRRQMVNALHRIIRFLYYIQDFSVPDQLGKNLIAICCK